MTKRRHSSRTAQQIVANMAAERRQLLQKILDLELALSACVSMLGGEARVTDHQVIAAGRRPLEYVRVAELKTTVIRVVPQPIETEAP